MARTQLRASTQIMAGTLGNTEVATDASIALSKLAAAADWDTSGALKAGVVANVEVATDAAIAYSKLNLVGEVTNTDVATDAAIAQSKLDLSIGNAEVATDAAIAYSKLNLALSVKNADVATDAAIAQSKLNLSITDSEMSTDASIAESKIAFDTTAGHNHDGTNSRLISGAATGKFDVSRETPTGNVDGTNADYTLASTPSSGSEHLWLNGNLQDEGTAEDYTISNAIVTMLSAPKTNSKIRVSYGTD